jgi:hypothetical protein
MNDEGELVRIFEYVGAVLSQKYRHLLISKDRRLRKVSRINYDDLQQEFGSILKEWVDEVDNFVGSFCQKSNDLLSQWRGYSDGTIGYCISFDEEKILESINEYNKQDENVREAILTKCIYSDKEVVEKIKAINPKAPHRSNKGWKNDMDKLLLLCAQSKHEGFEEEDEKRLLIKINDGGKKYVEFRSHNGMLIPYLKFNFNTDAIKSIKIGPSKNQNLAGRSLRGYLEKIGKDKIKIEYSDTPLRN